MRSLRVLTTTTLALTTLALAACGQSTSGDSASPSAPAASVSAAAGAKPAPFSAGPVKIAVVRQSGAGDYFQQWGSGAELQAKAAGIELQVYDAQGDNAKQATDLETAIGSGVAGIIVDHGQKETIGPLVKEATEKGIPTVVYDADVADVAPKAVVTSQSDEDLASLVLTQAAKDLGKDAKVGYVNARGFAPLDRRDVIWKKFVADNAWQQKFFVGKVTSATATDNVPLVDAALKANPDVTGIFAPYDELTKAATTAVKQNKLESKVKLYGIDISNADIEILTAANSPWTATATTDPNAIGAAVVRTAALHVAGQLNKTTVTFPGVLVTQQFLLENKVKNLADLRKVLPGLNLTEVSTAPWLSVISF
jgi:simple sugar transport system substrate-binding protein